MNSPGGFPLPPAGKKRWPLESQEQAGHFLENLNWPKISIVTPSYNQGEYIEETIRSAILQNYPNLEYIIIDGGSTDDTLEVIKKYEPWITYWVSEPDRGQSHAINKGLEKATGEWVAWLNADDVYLPNALHNVAEAVLNKNGSIAWIVGATIYTDSELVGVGRFTPSLSAKPRRAGSDKPADWMDFVCTKRSGVALPQPSSFWKRTAVMEAGGIDESLKYAMDHELYGRLAYLGYRPVLLDQALTCFRMHKEQKSTNFPVAFWQEELQVVYKWVVRTDGKEKGQLKRYGVFLENRIKWQPFVIFLQSMLSPFKNWLKRLLQSVYKGE